MFRNACRIDRCISLVAPGLTKPLRYRYTEPICRKYLITGIESMYASISPLDSLLQSRSHDSHVEPPSHYVVTLNQPNSNPSIPTIHAADPNTEMLGHMQRELHSISLAHPQ